MANAKLVEQYVSLLNNNMAAILLVGMEANPLMEVKEGAEQFIEEHEMFDELANEEEVFAALYSSQWDQDEIQLSIDLVTLLLDGKIRAAAQKIERLENLGMAPEGPTNGLIPQVDPSLVAQIQMDLLDTDHVEVKNPFDM